MSHRRGWCRGHSISNTSSSPPGSLALPPPPPPLRRERQRAADAAAAGARAVKDRQVHSVELEKYAGENSELREELRVLNEDLLAYREAVAELKGDLEDAAEDRVAQDAVGKERDARLAALKLELEEASAAIQRSSV